MCILKNGHKMYVFHERKKNLVLKEKYFQYFMKIKGEIRSSFKQIPLQKCNKIFLHIFPFLNILHSFLFFRKKTYILITAKGLAAYQPAPIYRLVRNLYIYFLRLTLRVDRASLTQV